MKAKKKTRAAALALVLALLLSVLPVTALADDGAGLNEATPTDVATMTDVTTPTDELPVEQPEAGPVATPTDTATPTDAPPVLADESGPVPEDEDDQDAAIYKLSAWTITDGKAEPVAAKPMLRASTYTMSKSSTGYTFTGAGTGTISAHYINGDLAWCIEAVKPSVSGDQYAEDAAAYAAIASVVQYAYDVGWLPGPTNAQIAAIQAAVWVQMGESIQITGGPDVDGVVNMANQILSYATYGGGTVTVYTCVTNSGHQRMATYAPYVAPQYGSAQVIKVSANSAITDGNPCYSLEGAVYGIYTSRANAQADTNRLGTLTTNSQGVSNVVDGLDSGRTRFIRELIAPKGYALDNKIYTLYISPNTTNVLRVSDEPQSDPVGVVLQKQDAATADGTPVSSAVRLAGAEYTVKYYPALAGTAEAPEVPSVAAMRTWVLKTDNDGFCKLDDNWFISGDTFFAAPNGEKTVPIGIVTIQETKAPEGYLIDPTVYIRQIRDDGTHAEWVQSYNAPIVREQPMRGNISITKQKELGRDRALSAEEGAEFEVFLKSAGSYAAATDLTRAKLVTDANGAATATDLPYGTYTVHQTAGHEGNLFVADFDVTIAEDGKTYSYNLINERIFATVTIIKKDARTGEIIPQAGVSFKLYDPTGAPLTLGGKDVFTTDDTGKVTLPEKLEYGHGYSIVEQNAPEGYMLDQTPVTFEVTTTEPIEVVVSDYKYPTIGTTATVGGLHVAPVSTDTDLVDVVAYQDLIPGRPVTIVTTVRDRATGKPILDKDGKPITLTTDYTPTEPDGNVTIHVIFDSTAYAGSIVNILEEVYMDGVLIAKHDDLADESQTVYFPAVGTKLATARGGKSVLVSTELTLDDTVTITGIMPGQEYELRGKLLVVRKDFKTGEYVSEPVLDKDGNPLTVTVPLTPEEPDITATVTFTFPAWKLGDKYVVATETLYMGELLLASHADLGDKDQTVHVYERVVGRITVWDNISSPRTGDVGLGVYAVLALLAVAGIVALSWRRRGVAVLMAALVLTLTLPVTARAEPVIEGNRATETYHFRVAAEDETPEVPKEITVEGKTYVLTDIREWTVQHVKPVTVERTVTLTRGGSVEQNITETVDGETITLTAGDVPTVEWGTEVREYGSRADVPETLTVDGKEYALTEAHLEVRREPVSLPAVFETEDSGSNLYYFGDKEITLDADTPTWEGYQADVAAYLGHGHGYEITGGRWNGDFTERDGVYSRRATYTGWRSVGVWYATYEQQTEPVTVVYTDAEYPDGWYELETTAYYEQHEGSIAKVLLMAGAGVLVFSAALALIIAALKKKNKKESED